MITQLLWLLSWPVLIAFSYYMVSWALSKFEDKLTEE